MTESTGSGQGIKSLDAALRVLDYLRAHDGPSSLTDIARACEMPPSKVHRYLATFIGAGLVQQRDRSGKYDLGLAALHLGLAAIGRHDFVNHAADGLPDLSAETGLTVLLSVWGSGGATVVRWERGVSPTATSMGLGTTHPLLRSATGRAFLTWAPPSAILKSREAELRHAARNPGLLPDVSPTKSGLETLVNMTRDRGYASVDGMYIPGLVAVAAPVLDWQSQAQVVITLVGTEPGAADAGSPIVRALLKYCAERSVN